MAKVKESIEGTTQEFLIACPGCDGTGINAHAAGDNTTCINCAGARTKLVRLNIPKRGDKMKLKVGSESLLEELFGRNAKTGELNITPDTEGTVTSVQMPEEHHLELGPTDLGIQLCFDKSKVGQRGVVKDGAELWIFDLYELRAA